MTVLVGGGAALADAARAPRGAQLPRRARLRPDRDLRADHRRAPSPTASPSWTRPAARACSRARARPTRPPTSCAWSTATTPTCRATARRMGEVVMRGNNVMLGYHDDPEAHGAAPSAAAGSTPATSPCGIPDGTIELRDRAKDIIISGGENISTIEVEQTLASHPAVLECAVVAIPHERWGERPKAFVTLREGAEATRRGADRALPRAHRALQGARRGRVRPAAEDLDRQGAEVRAARARVGRPRDAHQLSDERRRSRVCRAMSTSARVHIVAPTREEAHGEHGQRVRDPVAGRLAAVAQLDHREELGAAEDEGEGAEDQAAPSSAPRCPGAGSRSTAPTYDGCAKTRHPPSGDGAREGDRRSAPRDAARCAVGMVRAGS